MLMIMFFKEKDQEEWERSLFLVCVWLYPSYYP